MSRSDDAPTTTTTVQPMSSLLDGATGLVMIGSDGPALVCADGACAPADDEAGAPAAL